MLAAGTYGGAVALVGVSPAGIGRWESKVAEEESSWDPDGGRSVPQRNWGEGGGGGR
jgi:hypothetical protein